MRTMRINKRPFWYALYSEEAELKDSDLNYTGETGVGYSDPVEYKANISPATGQANLEMFGNLTDYDRVIVTDDVNIPIDENSVLWIDADPTKDAYNYTVRRVARSINSVAIAVRKVEVT